MYRFIWPRPPSVILSIPGYTGQAVLACAVTAIVLGGRGLPESGRTLTIESGWKLEDGEWRCYTAKWE